MSVTKRDTLLAAAAMTLASGADAKAATPVPDGVTRWKLYAPSPYGQVHIRAAAPASGKTARRPLVCFHTSPLSGAEYDVFMGEMAKDRLVLAPDNPGFGGSDGPPGPQSIPQYAAALAQAVHGCGLIAPKARYDVLGNHTGTTFCADLATTQAGRIDRVVMAGVPLFTPAMRVAMLEKFGKPNPIFSDPDYVARTFRAQVLGDGALSQERRLAFFIDTLRAGTVSWWAPQAVMAYPLDEALAKIRKPTLFLVVKDSLSANTREAAGHVPGAVLADLEAKTGDAVWDLQAKLMAETVRAFLDA